MIKIKKGLNIPIVGEPSQVIENAKAVKEVALIGADYIGMRPTMLVQEGDRVKLGQPLFEDKKSPGVIHTSPGCGTVKSVNRGEKRVFQSIVIEVDGDDEETFTSYSGTDLDSLNRDQVKENLVKSGLWTAIRQRPYGRVAALDTEPSSIFITAIDTNPHAPDVAHILEQKEEEFVAGLHAIRHLTNGKVHVCKGLKGMLPGYDLDFIDLTVFDGPHPAGLPGTHIHFLDPVSAEKSVFHIGYQDVIAIGHLFMTGKILTERVISIAGPTVENPRLLRTRMGASITELTEGELKPVDNRIISGSVISGRHVDGVDAYLGRYHLQISALLEGRERVLLGWQQPGFDKFSIKKVFASNMFGPNHKFDMTTSTEGSKRAMVPIGMYETVMPLDIIPTFLLRSLITKDTEQAQALGCLELDEEDLALCTFVCPGKYEYGPLLRENLTLIEKEG